MRIEYLSIMPENLSAARRVTRIALRVVRHDDRYAALRCLPVPSEMPLLVP